MAQISWWLGWFPNFKQGSLCKPFLQPTSNPAPPSMLSDLITVICIVTDACFVPYEGLAATFPATGFHHGAWESWEVFFLYEPITMIVTVFYFQGELGPPGPSGLTGLTGVGIQGEKVGKMSSSMFSHRHTSVHRVGRHSVLTTLKFLLLLRELRVQEVYQESEDFQEWVFLDLRFAVQRICYHNCPNCTKCK